MLSDVLPQHLNGTYIFQSRHGHSPDHHHFWLEVWSCGLLRPVFNLRRLRAQCPLRERRRRYVQHSREENGVGTRPTLSCSGEDALQNKFTGAYYDISESVATIDDGTQAMRDGKWATPDRGQDAFRASRTRPNWRRFSRDPPACIAINRINLPFPPFD